MSSKLVRQDVEVSAGSKSFAADPGNVAASSEDGDADARSSSQLAADRSESNEREGSVGDVLGVLKLLLILDAEELPHESAGEVPAALEASLSLSLTLGADTGVTLEGLAMMKTSSEIRKTPGICGTGGASSS